MINQITVPWDTSVYYRNRLRGLDLQAYDAIYNGLRSWEKVITVPLGLDISRLLTIYSWVIYDWPIFFHVRISIKVCGSRLMPDYCMTREEYTLKYNEVIQFVRNCSSLVKGCDSFSVLKILHDAMVRHVIYQGINDDYGHNVLGAIIYRKGVCESISKSFKMLCDACKITCIVVSGFGGRDYSPDKEENHAWNMARIGDSWYNLDVTYDINRSDFPTNNTIQYNYFCRSDEMFYRNHKAIPDIRPTGNNDYSIYRAYGLYVESDKDLNRLLKAAANNKTKVLCFEYDPAYYRSTADFSNIIAKELYKYYPGSSFTYYDDELMRVFKVILPNRH